MPLPRSIARFNRVVTNRISSPLARHLPGFAVIVHEGRVSGRGYRTPVNCWIDDRSAIVALTYGSDTDWLRNLEAARGGVVEHRGKTYRVGMPVLIGSEGLSRMPPVVRPILNVIDVDEFAELPLLSSGQPT
ncbi:MAG: nitroreductase family deazaflavin-dependent oxidoreductase [Actinomycetota bacterium]|nr:nitroreductase family deazaflavin-dependent oxidoreductase [Actinomycetota bacterium]